MSAFTRLPGNRVLSKAYEANSTDDARSHQIAEKLTEAFQGSDIPSLVYFAGYSGDFNKLLNLLRKNQEFQQYSALPVFSGDSAYNPRGYPPSSYKDIYFTAFASPDQWGNFPDPCTIDSSKPPSDVFCHYTEAFDPSHKYPGQYRISRTDATVMLTYDAATVLIQGYLTAYRDKKSSPAKQDVQQAIQGFDICHPLQGVSGMIAFAPDNNPINKAIVLLRVDSNGFTIFDSLAQGQLQASQLQGC